MKNKTILFVCTGNTCRSPMAELILKNKLKKQGIAGYRVKSAGLTAKDGDKISPNSRKALKLLGINVSGFKSRLCDVKVLLSSDLVICMTSSHKEKIKNYPWVYTLGELTGVGEIIDPYGQDEKVYEKTMRQIEKGCNVLINMIIKGEIQI